MKKFITLLVGILLLYAHSAQAYLICGHVWHKKDGGGRDHYIVALGDRHVPDFDEKEQIIQLMERIPSDSLVIVEGMFDLCLRELSSTSDKIARTIGGDTFVIPENMSPLLSWLTFLSTQHALDVINVEFRDYGEAIDSWLEKINADKEITISCSDMGDKLRQYAKISQKFLQEFARYDDPLFNNAYEDLSKVAEEGIGFFSELAVLLEQKKYGKADLATLKTILAREDGSRIQEHLEAIYCFSNGPLLDMKILHALAHNMHYPSIFILAGARHIRSIKPYIEQAGYQEVAVWQGEQEIFGQSVNVEKMLSPFFCPVRKIILNDPINIITVKPKSNIQITVKPKSNIQWVTAAAVVVGLGVSYYYLRRCFELRDQEFSRSMYDELDGPYRAIRPRLSSF